jgi:imidazolonepropionase-like amidohydrolase
MAATGAGQGSGSIENVYAIRAGRIVTVTRGVIESGTILIRDGVIEAVGREIDIPPDAEIVGADSMVVYPGLMDAHTSLGMPKPKKPETGANREGRSSEASRGPSPTLMAAEKKAVDQLNPKDASIPKVRDAGVTTVLTVPEDGIFIGQSALINLGGVKPRQMVVKSPVALHVGYERQRGVYPSTVMGVIAFQRQMFLNATHHKLLWDRYDKQKRGWRRPEPDASLDALVLSLEKKLPVVVSANKENEIKRALKLAEEFGFSCIISGAKEGWRVVDLLASRKTPVFVSVDFPKVEDVTGHAFRLEVEGPSPDDSKKEAGDAKGEEEKEDEEEDEVTPEEVEVYANAAVLHAAGIPFAFCSKGLKKPEEFLKNVNKTVAHGLSPEAALRALTIQAAEILGVDEQAGSIEAGKMANLIVTTVDLFDKENKLFILFVLC